MSRKSRYMAFAYGYGVNLCFSRSYQLEELHHLFGHGPPTCKEVVEEGDEATYLVRMNDTV